jgi:hypothetical protein
VGDGPKVGDADGLQAERSCAVEIENAVGLPLKVQFHTLKPAVPIAAVGLQLLTFVIEAEEKLLLIIAAHLREHAFLLLFQDAAKAVSLGLAALQETLFRVGLGLMAAFVEMGQEVCDVGGQGGQELLACRFRDRRGGTGFERLLKQRERAGLGIAGIGRERALSRGEVTPAGGDGDDFLMETDKRPMRATRGIESSLWARQARERS